MSDQDTQFLKDHLTKKNASEQLKSSNTALLDDADKFLEEKTADTDSKPVDLKEQIRQRRLQRQMQSEELKQRQLHRQAAKLDEQVQLEEEQKAEKERNDKLQQDQLEKERSESASKAIGQAAIAAGDKLSTTADRIGAIKTVGGIGLLLVILVILMFVVVQVNSQGDTRLKQLWYMLNGRASLIGKQQIMTGAGAGPGGFSGGASGDFADTNVTPTQTVPLVSMSQFRAPAINIL